MRKILNSVHPDDDAHYESMGLTRNVVQPWEDGMHTDGSKGTYEWWYSDAHFPDAENIMAAPLDGFHRFHTGKDGTQCLFPGHGRTLSEIFRTAAKTAAYNAAGKALSAGSRLIAALVLGHFQAV